MGATFEIYRDQHGDWRWRLRFEDDRVVAASPAAFRTREEALLGIEIVKADAARAPLHDLGGPPPRDRLAPP